MPRGPAAPPTQAHGSRHAIGTDSGIPADAQRLSGGVRARPGQFLRAGLSGRRPIQEVARWKGETEMRPVDRRTFGIALASLLPWSCSPGASRPSPATTPSTTMKNDLVFVTRDGCVNTPDMLINLDDALRALGLPLDYQV